MTDEKTDLPPCGLYVTTRVIGPVAANQLVYFHNHGNPGAGMYMPAGWENNRARFTSRGASLPTPADAAALRPLAPEGLYVVNEEFHCCAKQCQLYLAGALVQLGYNAKGEGILFMPRWENDNLVIPERGNRVEQEIVPKMTRLKIADSKAEVTTEDVLH